jgi:preprotein translocase subunit SecB
MSSEGNIPAGGENGAGENQAPSVHVVGQYIKDLSFENPAAPASPSSRPQIDLSVDLQARQVEQERYEVELKLRVSATGDNKPMFLLELVYAGLLVLHNIPEEVRSQVLLIEAPHMLFPYARRIVSDVVRDGGLPALMIEPIDFAALYRAKMAEAQQQGQAAPAVPNA